MTPESWKKVGELFHAALEVPASERRQWVEAACEGDPRLLAEVLSLLGSDAAAGEGFIAKRLEPVVASLLRSRAEPTRPERAGPYLLVRELGRGGMGTVYLGERDDDEYQTQVAVKLVRRGMDTEVILNRFYRERQTLARLQHPNIARLLDGGTTTEGDPYIVMEYVEGEKITSFCDQRGLNTSQRLALFLDVCKAVDYAHRQFVVHRDIKPGNILVDQAGQVKLLDFGICKLLQTPSLAGEETVDAGLLVLTPDYASPEQIRGDAITVTSDVYSLAAVLYELLTGVKPHKIEEYTLRGMERAICETEIPVPSVACESRSAARALEGDLDNILLRALSKDARRRYESVDHFAEDIRRHLAHLPVKARPDSVTYRLGKFVRRRQGLVAAAAAVLLTLSAGVVVSFRSARQANENLRLVRQLSNTFVFDVYDAVRDLPGSTRARQLIVNTGLQYLESLSRNVKGDADFGHELATAYQRAGDVQGDVMGANLGNTKEALGSYHKALALLDDALRSDPNHRNAQRKQITLHRRIGNIHAYAQDAPQALASFGQAEKVAEALLARAPEDMGVALQLAEVQIALANTLRRGAEWTKARDGYVRALALLEQVEKADPNDRETQSQLAVAASGAGLCDVRLGRLREALDAYRRAAVRREKLIQLDPSNVTLQRDMMFLHSHVGDVLGNPNLPNLGDPKGAAEAYGRMMEVARRIHEADPADQRARSDYAIATSRVAALAQEAPVRIRLLNQAVQTLREVVQQNPANRSDQAELAFICLFLGDAHQQASDSRNALLAYRDGLKLAEGLLPNGPATVTAATVMLYRKIGELVAGQGQREAGLALARQALQLSDPEGPVVKGRTADSKRFLAARGSAAAGQIYAVIAKSASSRPADRPEARRWLETALEQYRALESHRSFSSIYRDEMQAVQQALEQLR